jgi:trehalose-phosphatase
MRPLFACWGEVAARLASHRLIALFLDFDGTLAPIQPRPEMAQVDPSLLKTLEALARNPRIRVWVISARRRAEVVARIRAPAIHRLGLFGLERGSRTLPPSGPIMAVKEALRATLPRHPAVWIEDKRITLAVHYRDAPAPVCRLAAECVNRAVEPWSGSLRIAPGKCVWEVIPRELGDKGAGVRREVARCPGRVLPVFVGDDVSDESGFASLAATVGIRVGTPARTRARYRVEGPEQVHRFLEKLRAELL